MLALCFFGSGLTGLVYELIWLRRLQLTFGSTTYSVTTVLAAFMAGLGIGSYLIGRWVDRSRMDPIKIYALLELGIGLFAVVSLPLLSLAESAYVAIQSRLSLGHGGASVLKLALAFPVLAFPAGLMGGTLPALVKGLMRERAAMTHTVGWLYGVNTAGAATGTALTGMVLIELLGLWRSVALAVVINLGIAALVLICLRLGAAKKEEPPRAAGDEPAPDGERDEPDEPDEPAALAPAIAPGEEVGLLRHIRSAPVLFCAVAVVLTGSLSMLYEVVWTRMLSMVLGSSTYAFTIVLTIFLIGIAAGAMIYGRMTRDRRRVPSALSLTAVLLALAIWAALTLVAIPSLPLTMLWMIQLPGVSFARMLIFEVLLALFLLLIPTLLLGVALPMSMSIISRAAGHIGRDVGGVYLANTSGAIAGSVLSGFVLIPLLGTQDTLLLGLGANLALVAAGGLAFGGPGWRRVLILGAAALLGAISFSRPTWPPSVFDAGLNYQLHMKPSTTAEDVERRLTRAPTRLLSFQEGVNATISVREASDAVSLFVNGKPDASTYDDMHHQVLLGIVGGMAHPRPRSVGIVGWGSGVTTYTLTFFPEVERLDVAEIEKAVVDASPYFRPFNGSVEKDPRVHLYYDDARSHFLTTSQTYDLIVSQPSNPWMVGVSGLFSADFYRLVKGRLRPGGILTQWFQLYSQDSEAVALVFRTVLDAFRHVQLWYSDMGDVILLASDRPILHSMERVRRAYRADPRIAYHMDAYGPGPAPEQFFGCYLLDRSAMEKIVRRFSRATMTDDRPVLEYLAVRGLYHKTRDHIKDLWRAKITLNQIQPPHTGAPPPPGPALAGATAILTGVPTLRRQISDWAIRRYGEDPGIRLQRAKILVQSDEAAAAQKVLDSLDDAPALKADVALQRAKILLHQGRPAEAMARLDEMGSRRIIPRLWFQLRVLLMTKRLDEAWRRAEELMRRLSSPRDPDVRRMPLSRFYQTLDRLITATRAHGRGIRLLNSKARPHGGEIFRLAALVDAHRALGQARAAARTMDRMMEFGLIDRYQLLLCEQVYGKVKAREKAAACRRTRMRISALSASEPLWPVPKRRSR